MIFLVSTPVMLAFIGAVLLFVGWMLWVMYQQ